MRMIIIGFGVVGRSLAEMLISRSSELRERYGIEVKVVAVVDSGGAAVSEGGVDLIDCLEAKRRKGSVSAMAYVGRPGLEALEALELVEGDLVVEVTPTNIKDGEPGLTHIRRALSMGRHVITTNKGPIALALPTLLELSRRNNVCLRFSGTVGGGVPILSFAERCLHGDEVLSIRGVLNSTTNYILWRMAEGRISMEEAYMEARRLGYAEADPTYDIDGIDTACKLVILANHVMGLKARLSDVKIKGIRGITLKEVIEAHREGLSVRLIGAIDGGMKVSPELLSKQDPLCVDSILNAVTFTCSHSGQHTLIGKGAGGPETASSIIRDMIDIKRAAQRAGST